MIVTALKTRKVAVGDSLTHVLDTALPALHERDIVVVTSKIISICERNVVPNDDRVRKEDLVKKHADWLLKGKNTDRYGITLTITRNILIANAGIDESNGAGYFVLWPKEPHKTAQLLWQHLRKKHGRTHVGVIITDSHTTPMRWGVTGLGLSWCGFAALKNYIGTPDINGRILRVTKANLLDGLSAAATVVMGEGKEQTPLAVIRNTPFVSFQDHSPTTKERNAMIINRRNDLYADLIDSPFWKKAT